jgi:hypothetical protein
VVAPRYLRQYRKLIIAAWRPSGTSGSEHSVMRLFPMAAAIPAAALIGFPVTLLGWGGMSFTPPGLDGCATSLSQDGVHSYQQARKICAGASDSLQPDLNYCASSLAQSPGFSQRKAREVCKSGPH